MIICPCQYTGNVGSGCFKTFMNMDHQLCCTYTGYSIDPYHQYDDHVRMYYAEQFMDKLFGHLTSHGFKQTT